jgi:hypothetical protein
MASMAVRDGVVFEVAGLGELGDELAGHGFEMAQHETSRARKRSMALRRSKWRSRYSAALRSCS